MSQNIKNLFAQIHESGTAKQDSSSTINDKYKNGGEAFTEVSGRAAWNVSESRMSEYNMASKNISSFQNYTLLAYENERLRSEVRLLQKIIAGTETKVEPEFKTQSEHRIGYTSYQRRETNSEEIPKLKKLIEKSYFSIRQMEIQIENLTEKLRKSERECDNLQSKLKINDFHKEEASRKMTNLAEVHKQETKLLNDRIHKLEDKIGQLVGLIEEDQQDWRQHMSELNNFKRFYLHGMSK